MRKLWCKLFGHKLYKAFAYFNGRSHYGMLMCGRCGKTKDWQYDI